MKDFFKRQCLMIVAIAFLFMCDLAVAANNGFIRATPAEVQSAQFSTSLLGAILNVISWVVLIIGAVGLVGVALKTIDSAVKTLAAIDYGQATYGKLIANIVAGIAIMLIFVGMMTFAWSYITGAGSQVGSTTVTFINIHAYTYV